jgi:uncharacterized protein YodC (DUF2158 family)
MSNGSKKSVGTQNKSCGEKSKSSADADSTHLSAHRQHQGGIKHLAAGRACRRPANRANMQPDRESSRRGNAMADEIKVGDVVELKSGGPKMSVQRMGQYQTVGGAGANCTWFSNGKESSKVFAVAVLKKIE